MERDEGHGHGGPRRVSDTGGESSPDESSHREGSHHEGSHHEGSHHEGSHHEGSHHEEEWIRIERTSAFRELTAKKKAFIIPATIFFLVFYFGLPFLTAFTSVLDARVLGPLNLAYVYAFAQFAMTWILMHLYVSRANRWDELVDRARHEAAEGVGNVGGGRA